MTDARRIFGKAPTMRLPGGVGSEGLWGLSSSGYIDINVENGDGCIIWAGGTIGVTGVGYVIRDFAGGCVIDFVDPGGTAHIYREDSCASWEFLVHMKLIPESGGMG